MLFCRFPRAELNVMASSTTDMARCRYMRHSTPKPVRCSVKPPPGTHPPNRRLPYRYRRQSACGKEIHVIADNLSAHKSQPVKDFPENHSQGSSAFHSALLLLLNQVEL